MSVQSFQSPVYVPSPLHILSWCFRLRSECPAIWLREQHRAKYPETISGLCPRYWEIINALNEITNQMECEESLLGWKELCVYSTVHVCWLCVFLLVLHACSLAPCGSVGEEKDWQWSFRGHAYGGLAVMHGCGWMAEGSGFQLLIMTDLYPATALSFLLFPPSFSLIALIMSFTCCLVASLGLLLTVPNIPVLSCSFGCRKFCQIKSTGRHMVNVHCLFLLSYSEWCPVVQRESEKKQSYIQLQNAGQSSQWEPRWDAWAWASAAEIWDHAVFCRFWAQIHQGGRRWYENRDEMGGRCGNIENNQCGFFFFLGSKARHLLYNINSKPLCL